MKGTRVSGPSEGVTGDFLTGFAAETLDNLSLYMTSYKGGYYIRFPSLRERFPGYIYPFPQKDVTPSKNPATARLRVSENAR